MVGITLFGKDLEGSRTPVFKILVRALFKYTFRYLDLHVYMKIGVSRRYEYIIEI